jgi:Leucine-rich repeat (LRR) protein
VLQALDVSGNPLGSLPPFFGRLQALNKLVLASTHLPLLPAFISSLTALQHLNLASNKLQVRAACLQ